MSSYSWETIFALIAGCFGIIVAFLGLASIILAPIIVDN